MSESAAKFLPHVRLLLHYVVMKSDVGQKIILDVSYVFWTKVLSYWSLRMSMDLGAILYNELHVSSLNFIFSV